MRVDLSPRLRGHSGQSTLLSSSHSPFFPPPPRPGTVKGLKGPRKGLTAGVEQSHELNLNLRFTLL